MIKLVINWQPELNQSQTILKTNRDATKPKFFSDQSIESSGYRKPLKVRPLKMLKQETDFPANIWPISEDTFLKSIKMDSGVIIEPHLSPDNLIQFFKEKPLIPFESPEEKSRNAVEEATYRWLKKKMCISKQR